MLEITQLSNVTQFVFFAACGYLTLQLPFGWVATVMSLLLMRDLPLASSSVWGISLEHPSVWIGYLIILELFVGLGFAYLQRLTEWTGILFFGIGFLVYLAGIVFSAYTLFTTTSTFTLDIGIKILAFLVGLAFGATSWIILHAVALLSAMSSSYNPQLILTALTVSVIVAAVVTFGTYFIVTSPKVAYWILGGVAGIILFIFVGFFSSLFNARWT